MAAVAFGCEGEGKGEVDPREEGEAQEPRARVGARGGLILPRRRRGGAAGTCPCSDPGRGNREGEGATERGGPGRLGLVVGPVGPGSSGGRGSSFCFCSVFFFCNFFSFIYLLFCFISI